MQPVEGSQLTGVLQDLAAALRNKQREAGRQAGRKTGRQAERQARLADAVTRARRHRRPSHSQPFPF